MTVKLKANFGIQRQFAVLCQITDSKVACVIQLNSVAMNCIERKILLIY